MVPEERSTLQAGHLLENLPLLWSKANPEERHAILSGFLEAVYVDLATKQIVGIRPKPQFLGLLGMVDTNTGGGALLQNKSSEPENGSEPEMTGWWRRGRVDITPSIIPDGLYPVGIRC